MNAFTTKGAYYLSGTKEYEIDGVRFSRKDLRKICKDEVRVYPTSMKMMDKLDTFDDDKFIYVLRGLVKGSYNDYVIYTYIIRNTRTDRDRFYEIQIREANEKNTSPKHLSSSD